jgi:hypothetical protein
MPYNDLTTFLLHQVRQKPELFLLDKKLGSLRKFVTGYLFALNANFPEKKDRFLDMFSDWFFKATNNEQMWYAAILEECNFNEEKALDKFWQYLDDFDMETKGD